MAVPTDLHRSRWLVPALLMLVSIVPAAAGIARLAGLSGNAQINDENARFLAAPLVIVLHILVSITFGLLATFQFSPALRRDRPGWHRAAGRVLVVCGLGVALTGVWMAQTYSWPPGDGQALYLLRLMFGSAMAISIVLAVVAVRRRDFAAHSAWMTRSYAIGMGAGTQVLTHLPYIALVGKPDEWSRAVLMGAGWVINIIVAEWIIHKPNPRC